MATSANFVQLHNHTHYSLLDGASKIPDLVKRAKELGMPAVGITDHGNMHGAYEMWSAAVNAGIKPIIGIEAYVTPETARQDPTRVSWDTNWNPDLDPLHRRRNPDDVSGGGVITHLTMWAENDEGLVNLMKASTDANLEGRVMRYPRMDKEILAKYSKGIIASSGCPSGIIQTRLRLGQFDDALRAAGEFQDIFGRDNFYIEFMDHGLKIEKQVTDGLLDIAKKLNEDAKQWKISLWSYHDGEWKCQGSVVDEIKPGIQSVRFAVRLTTEECTFYTMDGTRPSSISFEKIDSDFEQTQTVIDQRIEQKTPFAIGEEVTLWAKLGVDGQQIEAGDLTKDFRSCPCTAGAAVTVTILDEEPQEQQE